MERILKPMFRFIFFWIRIVKKKYREISYREIVSGSGAASIEPTPKSRHPKADTPSPIRHPKADTPSPIRHPKAVHHIKSPYRNRACLKIAFIGTLCPFVTLPDALSRADNGTALGRHRTTLRADIGTLWDALSRATMGRLWDAPELPYPRADIGTLWDALSRADNGTLWDGLRLYPEPT